MAEKNRSTGSSRIYWTKDTDADVLDWLDMSDGPERERFFETRVHPKLSRLSEGVGSRFRTAFPRDEFEELIIECVTFLWKVLRDGKLDRDRGRPFTFLSKCAQNFFKQAIAARQRRTRSTDGCRNLSACVGSDPLSLSRRHERFTFQVDPDAVFFRRIRARGALTNRYHAANAMAITADLLEPILLKKFRRGSGLHSASTALLAMMRDPGDFFDFAWKRSDERATGGRSNVREISTPTIRLYIESLGHPQIKHVLSFIRDLDDKHTIVELPDPRTSIVLPPSVDPPAARPIVLDPRPKTRGRPTRHVTATADGDVVEFESIAVAAQAFDVSYSTLYKLARQGGHRDGWHVVFTDTLEDAR